MSGLFDSLCRSVYRRFPLLRKYQGEYECLGFTEAEIGKMFSVFRKNDVDVSETISISEMFTMYDIENTSFTRKLFRLFDVDGSNSVDFFEYICCLWNYLCNDKITLISFAFDVYDTNGSHSLTRDEVIHLVGEVWGESGSRDEIKNKHARHIVEYLRDEDGFDALGVRHDAYTITKFIELNKEFTVLLFPAFTLQTAMRNKILNERVWDRITGERLSNSEGSYLRAASYIDRNMHRFKGFGSSFRRIQRHSVHSLSMMYVSSDEKIKRLKDINSRTKKGGKQQQVAVDEEEEAVQRYAQAHPINSKIANKSNKKPDKAHVVTSSKADKDSKFHKRHVVKQEQYH